MQSAFERRQEILSVMNSRRHDTLDNLAFEFSVSKMTIRRDIEALALNSPIYTTQGNGGGVHVVDGVSLRGRYLTEEQVELLKRLSVGLGDGELEIVRGILKGFSVPNKGKRSEVKGESQREKNA